MATYQDMQNRIADELGRSGLTSQIQNAILDAVKLYERRRVGFNETTFTFSTVISQEYYGSAANANIASLSTIDAVHVTRSSSTLEVRPRTFAWIERAALGSTTATADPPTDYCYYGLQLRLYPIPSAVRTITVAAHYKLATLSLPTDSNGWTNDMEELIRQTAKVRLLLNVIRGPDAAQEAAGLQAMVAQLEAELWGEQDSRSTMGTISAVNL